MARADRLLFSRKLFNPNFYHLVNELKNPFRRFIFSYGGSSSGKSYSFAQAVLVYCCLIEGSNTLVFKKVSKTIKKSIYNDFKTAIKQLSLENYFEVQDFKIICYNGSVVEFSGIDDPEKIKGISSFKRVFMDELSEFDEADFKQVRKRLRGVRGQQIVCAFNPIDVDHWIKVSVFDKQTQNMMDASLSEDSMRWMSKRLGDPTITTAVSDIKDKWEGDNIVVLGKEYPPNFVVMRSTYLNNYWVSGSPCGEFGFLDVQTIADFEKDRTEDFNSYQIYALAEWGKTDIGGEMYKSFDTEHHVEHNSYNEELPLHLTFDENVNPYMTLDIHQASGLSAWQIDEVCLEDPRNTLDYTLREFRTRYPNNGQPIYIYGDATSKKADVKLEKGKNFYTLIENDLRGHGYTVINRVTSSNPNVSVRTKWLDKIFRTGLDGISIKIGANCLKTIADFKYLKEDSDGTKFKEKVKHPVTGIRYEKYGHNTDANEYFYCVYFANSFRKYSKPQGAYKSKMVKRSRKKAY